MATICLIEGPVGAGKSTHAFRLSRELSAPHIDLDEWMVTLFRPDRPETDFMAWYATCKARCIEQIWWVSCEILEAGSDVVLELGLVTRADRQAFYERVALTDYSLRVVVLDAPEAVRLERVRARNRDADGTFKMAVSDEIFAFANRAWEPPDAVEMSERDIEYLASAE